MNNHHLTYCPACGAPGLLQLAKSVQCPACLMELYFNPSAAVCALIVNAEGEIQNDWGVLGRTPGVAQALGATSSVLISSYNYEYGLY